MQSLMEKISAQLSPIFGSFLNGPAAIEEIEKVERQIGVDFPTELKELYLIHNGDLREVPGLFFGMAFLSLKEMLGEWQFSSEAADVELTGKIPSYAMPEGSIQEQYFNKKWLPLAHDYGGNYLAVDLNPGEKGTYGQIINYGQDEEVKYVIAHSTREFLEFISKTIEEGFYTIDEEETWSYGDVEYTHFFGILKDIPLPVLHAKAEETVPAVVIDAEWRKRIEEMSGSFNRFTKMKTLHLGNRGIIDLAPLAACSDVRELVLSSNQIKDLTPLQTLKALKKLYLGGNPIASLGPLEGLENLQYLNIFRTEVADAAPLITLKKLKELDMANTKITDYRFLEQMANLQTLTVSIFSYDQLAALINATQLKHLHIPQLTGVTHGDLRLFSKLKQLQSLTISHCAFRDLNFLSGNQKLKELVLVDCEIKDGSAINKLPVEELECNGTRIDNLEILAESPSLQTFTGSFQQFWTLKQCMTRPVDFSKIIGDMTGSEEVIWSNSLDED